jgi:hypothetical protein
VLLEILKLLSLTTVLPETKLSSTLYEYTPTAKETPPPYEFRPWDSPLDNDNALQPVKTLPVTAKLPLLTTVSPETVLLPPLYA